MKEEKRREIWSGYQKYKRENDARKQMVAITVNCATNEHKLWGRHSLFFVATCSLRWECGDHKSMAIEVVRLGACFEKLDLETEGLSREVR